MEGSSSINVRMHDHAGYALVGVVARVTLGPSLVSLLPQPLSSRPSAAAASQGVARRRPVRRRAFKVLGMEVSECVMPSR